MEQLELYMRQALINGVGFKSAILVNVAVLKRQTGPVIRETRLNGCNLNVLGAPMARAIEVDVYRQTRMVFLCYIDVRRIGLLRASFQFHLYMSWRNTCI